MTEPWRIELFGGLCLRHGQREITRFPTRKTAALLAYLAYYRQRPHSREELIERIWPECDLNMGRNRLSTLLAFLRRLLERPDMPGTKVLLADRLFVQLNPAVLTTDVDAFDSLLRAARSADSLTEQIRLLENAVALYKGELLPGYYEDWVLEEQICLRERYVDTLEHLSACLERAGSPEDALHIARRAMQADPYREASYQAIIRLNTTLNRPTAAREAYRALVELCRQIAV